MNLHRSPGRNLPVTCAWPGCGVMICLSFHLRVVWSKVSLSVCRTLIGIYQSLHPMRERLGWMPGAGRSNPDCGWRNDCLLSWLGWVRGCWPGKVGDIINVDSIEMGATHRRT